MATKQLGPIEQIQVVKYAGASGDFNPIHTVPEAAAKAKLPSTIAHGMMSMGFLGTLVTDWLGVDAELKKFGVRFTSMTLPGDMLTLTGRIAKKYEHEGQPRVDLELSIEKQDGATTVKGWAVVEWRKP